MDNRTVTDKKNLTESNQTTFSTQKEDYVLASMPPKSP